MKKTRRTTMLLALIAVLALAVAALVACANTAVITFDGNGATGGTVPQAINTTMGSTVTLPECELTKTGHTFDGWKTGDTTYKAGDAFEVTAAETTFVAQWKAEQGEPDPDPETYALTYAAGDHGTGTAPAAVQKEAGAKFNLAAATLFTAETGYEFDGWSDGANSYAAGAEFTMPAKAVTMTAQWKAVQHTVTFDPNNEGAPWTVKVNHGETVAKPSEDPTISSGKTFRYWANGSEYNFSTPVTEDIELTATYAWKVTFLAGEGATGTVESQWVTMWRPNAITLPQATGLSNGSKVFVGWNDGTATYDAGDLYGTSGLQNVTFTAQWKDAQPIDPATKYTVTWFKSTNDSQIANITGDLPADLELAAGETITMPAANTLTFAHYTFNKWRVQVFVVNSDGSGNWETMYDGDTPVNILPEGTFTMPAKNIRILGTWTINKVTISFDANGGSGSMTSIKKDFNSGLAINTPTYDCQFTAPSGKEFEGWSFSANGAIIAAGTKLDASVVSAEDTVTLYAIWKSTTVTPTTPLIDEIKGSWTATGHTLDIIAGSEDDNDYLKGYAVLDGKHFLHVMDNEGAYYLSNEDLSENMVYYELGLSGDTLTLTPFEGDALSFANKTELTNANRNSFVGKWNKESTSTITGTTSVQPWVIGATDICFNQGLTKVSDSMVIGNHLITVVMQLDSYNTQLYYVHVLALDGENLSGWCKEPEKEPVSTTLVPADFLTLTVDGKLNQLVNSGSAPDADKITTPTAPEGQVFSKWVLAGTETEFNLTAAMTADVSIEAKFTTAAASSIKTYVGEISDGKTITQIVINETTAKVSITYKNMFNKVTVEDCEATFDSSSNSYNIMFNGFGYKLWLVQSADGSTLDVYDNSNFIANNNMGTLTLA